MDHMRWIFAVALLVCWPSLGWAQNAVIGSGCDGQDVLGYCGNEFAEGAKSTFSTDHDEYGERTETVREAAGNCFDCAMERLRRDIEEIDENLRKQWD